jgi:hypothetical protein
MSIVCQFSNAVWNMITCSIATFVYEQPAFLNYFNVRDLQYFQFFTNVPYALWHPDLKIIFSILNKEIASDDELQWVYKFPNWWQNNDKISRQKSHLVVKNSHYCLVSLMWMKIGSNELRRCHAWSVLKMIFTSWPESWYQGQSPWHQVDPNDIYLGSSWSHFSGQVVGTPKITRDSATRNFFRCPTCENNFFRLSSYCTVIPHYCLVSLMWMKIGSNDILWRTIIFERCQAWCLWKKKKKKRCLECLKNYFHLWGLQKSLVAPPLVIQLPHS